MTAGQSRRRMRRHARRLRRYGLEPIAIINPGDPLPEIAAVVIGRWLWRYRSELAPLLAALATFAAGWLLHRTLRPAKAKAHLQPKRKIGYRPGRSEGDMYETVVSEGDLNSHSGVGLDVLNDDNDLPVRTLRDGVPDSQTIRWKMDPVRIWQRVPFGKRVGKCRDWFFKQVKDRPVGGVSKLVAAALRVRPRSCPGSGEPGHSLIPQVSASSSRVKIRPSPESDRMRLSASASPASRRRRRFSARRASSSARGIEPYLRCARSSELLTAPGRPESRSSWKAGREGEFGGTRLQVAQGRIGEGRERFVIVRLHPALERDTESEHAR